MACGSGQVRKVTVSPKGCPLRQRVQQLEASLLEGSHHVADSRKLGHRGWLGHGLHHGVGPTQVAGGTAGSEGPALALGYVELLQLGLGNLQGNLGWRSVAM